ncbi:PREDICTED: acid phosphatase 1-like [Tarenaya hassleriana]|uniref:acid phosphatase 1-like n=1 Tax=Tarenaya hassleriana TaxID=28532 RepID=UPI00053C884F|nr:PREDICTED: acid phosphatase 1-like [Tarenaya hassleriana]
MAILSLIFSLITLLIFPAAAVIKLPSDRSGSTAGEYCESWRLAVETNNAGSWNVVPVACKDFVADYVTGGQFDSDYEVMADYAVEFAKTLKIAGDGYDAWVFDIDETLLTNIDYYKAHGFGTEPFDGESFNAWVESSAAPAFDASLRLYNELKKLGFTIFLLTGRDEGQRSCTEKNLQYAGYSNWERLILRGHEDQGKAATTYKSEKRSELIKEGYKIHGSTGDQWSDLVGFAVAKRSFKVPNPMYYIP